MGAEPREPDASGQAARRRSGQLSALVVEILRGAERQALTPAQVRQRLADGGHGRLAYTTVVTILSRLHAQGLAERSRVGRAFAYLGVSDPARLAARRMRRVLDAENDRDAVLASFVRDLSPGDEHRLRQLLGPDLAATPDDPVPTPRHGGE